MVKENKNNINPVRSLARDKVASPSDLNGATSYGINESLKKLEKIVQWFQQQEELDVQQGLDKVKEGAALVKELKSKLKEVENEFVEVKKELEN